MDAPTRQCENDTGIEMRFPGLPEPKREPQFFWHELSENLREFTAVRVACNSSHGQAVRKLL